MGAYSVLGDGVIGGFLLGMAFIMFGFIQYFTGTSQPIPFSLIEIAVAALVLGILVIAWAAHKVSKLGSSR